jgi:hypothetical protein
MPYFVFNVKPYAQIQKLAEFDGFREASSLAKSLRSAQPEPASGRIKIMFADSLELAEDLLCQTREPGPAGDD